MTKLVDGPSSVRGERRRNELVDAGVSLLAEHGWQAITTRGVAARAGANVGLVHYHFGGLPALRLAIAARALDVVLGPLVEDLLTAEDVSVALAAFRRMVSGAAADTRVARLAVELLTEAVRDDVVRELTRDGLRVVRERFATRLAAARPEWSVQRRSGAVVLLAALIDGLVLHLMLDSELSAEAALATLGELLGVEPDQKE